MSWYTQRMARLSKKAIKFSTYMALAGIAFIVSFFVSGSRYGELLSGNASGLPIAHADAPACGILTGDSDYSSGDGGKSGGGGGGKSGGLSSGGGDGDCGGCGGSGCGGGGGDSGSGSGGDSGGDGGSDCL